MFRKLRILGMLLPLLAMLGIGLYAALQNQDIRNRAGNTSEYLQLTPATMIKKRRALTRVVVSNLKTHLRYRLVFDITHAPNPDFPPPSGVNPPPNKKKTMRIAENKTYSFTYKLDTCYYISKISVKLYSRERGKGFVEVPSSAVDTTELKPPCQTTKVQATPAPNNASNSGEPASSAGEVEITNGQIPEDAGVEPSDTNIVEIDGIEDESAITNENNTAAQELSAANTQPSATTQPTAVPTTVIPTNIPAPTNTISASPTTQQLAQLNPSSTPTPTSSSADKQPTATPTTQNPSPSAKASGDTAGGFGSLLSISPTSAVPASSADKQPSATPRISPTIPPAPFSDFARRTQAETNATPTPFPIFHPAGTPTPVTQFGQIAYVRQTNSGERNPLVPESPLATKPESSSFSLFDSIFGFIRGIFNFIANLFG